MKLESCVTLVESRIVELSLLFHVIGNPRSLDPSLQAPYRMAIIYIRALKIFFLLMWPMESINALWFFEETNGINEGIYLFLIIMDFTHWWAISYQQKILSSKFFLLCHIFVTPYSPNLHHIGISNLWPHPCVYNWLHPNYGSLSIYLSIYIHNHNIELYLCNVFTRPNASSKPRRCRSNCLLYTNYGFDIATHGI